MKKSKPLFCLVLLVCAVFAVCLCADAVTDSGSCGTGVHWSFDTETGILEISGAGAMTDYATDTDVPWHSRIDDIQAVHIGDGVTNIGDLAFFGCEQLTEVTIENSVTRIGDHAFAYCPIGAVTLPDGLESIGEEAFFNCWALASVEIPASVKSIGDYAFTYCFALQGFLVHDANAAYASDAGGVLFNKAKTVLLQYPTGSAAETYSVPDGVRVIRWSAFEACGRLTSVSVPASVISIGTFAFADCGSLQEIAVDDCNTKYCSEDGVLFNADMTKLIVYPAGKAQEIYRIPDTVTDIALFAFSDCTSLISVEVPASATYIGEGAFYACASIEEIVVDGGNANYYSEDGVLLDTDTAELIAYPIGNPQDAYTTPADAESIGACAFEGCSSLTSVTIADGTLRVGEYAFAACDALTSVEIPDSVTRIGEGAFDGCPEALVVYGYTGSCAEAAAKKYGFTFISLGESAQKNLGDADGDGEITVLDAVAVLQYCADMAPETFMETAADTDRDGSIGVRDAVRILEYCADLIQEF